MKRCLAVIIAVLTVMSSVSVFAEEVTYTLSLEDAINMAMEENPQFISANTKIKNAQKQLEEAKKDRKNAKGAIRIPSGISLAFVKNGYYVAQAEVGVESAKRERIKAENTLRYELTQKYYSVKLAEALLKSAQDTYKIASENKNAIDIQFSLGLVSELDVNNAEYALMQSEAACDRYERNLSVARENLKISLQIDDENSILILTDGIEYRDFETNVSEDIEKAMETRLDVYSLKAASELAKSYADTMSLLLGEKSSEYSAANQSFVQSEYTYTNTKKLIGLSIKSSYNEILNTGDSLKLAEKNAEIKMQEYNVAKVQYDIGMITNTQLTGALNASTNAQIELENAKLNYKLAVEKYGYEITLGL